MALVLCGCQAAGPTVTLTPQEELELESRSLDLLLRAAESELDDVTSNAIEALVQVAPREGRPAFRKAIRSQSPLVRYAGFVALGQVRDCAALEAIVAGVREPHRQVRLAAAFAAYRCGKEGAAGILVRTLTDHPDESLRADAAALIGRLQEPRAEKWLRAALRYPANEKCTRVRLQINWALAMLGRQDALHELIDHAQGGPATRAEALLLLAQLGEPAATEALRYRLFGSREQYDEARLIAARGLGKLGFDDGLEFALQMLAFEDPNPNPGPEAPDRTFPIRSMAIHALAEIGDLRALPPLREIAAQQDDPRLQVAACYAICKILQHQR